MSRLHLILLFVLTIGWQSANAVEATLSVTVNGKLQHYSAEALRSRSDAVTITVENDPSYRRPMTYRAIPLTAIFEGASRNESLFLEAKALDGFVSELLGALALSRDTSKAIAMLAIEDPAAPWPPLPGKSVSAGPFYLVWIGGNVTAIRSEQWPYQLTSIAEEEAPEKRWPQLAVGPILSKSDPRRLGQHLFIVQCLVCHKLDGGGNSDVGPDLNRPMNPTEYFTLPALRKFLRNPTSVRNWPERKMPPFGTDALSDADIDRIIQYLQHKAANRKRSEPLSR
jgi:mono/diheme cytochrome c family protein